MLLPPMAGHLDDLVASWQYSAVNSQEGSPSTGAKSVVVINGFYTAWSRDAMSQALMSLHCFGRIGWRYNGCC